MSVPLASGVPAVARRSSGGFWGTWILANAGSELAGLGAVALVGWGIASSMNGQETLLQHILAALAMVAAGCLEGALAGAAQGWVLRGRLPALRIRDWIRATVLGALVAWLLGMLPSTLLSLAAAGAPGEAQAPPEMSPWLRYGLAALMGAALGPVLALFQWRVLRRHLPRAGGWIGANALAWALGMPVIFLGAHGVAAGAGSLPLQAALVAATLTLAGAAVGAVHGAWLARRL